MHPGHLLRREHEHGVIVDVIHVVHKHVAVWAVVAGDAGEGRFSEVGSLGVWRIGNKIAPTAVLSIPPDVTQIEPMADLMGGCSPQVKWRCGGASRAEGGVQD